MDKLLQEILCTLDKKTVVLWAADCAEHVLSSFAETYPQDNRPWHAIMAGRSWVDGEIGVKQARTRAVHAHAAACFVARAAATVHAVGHAVHAAAYAVKASTHTAQELDWQYRRLQWMKKKYENMDRGEK